MNGSSSPGSAKGEAYFTGFALSLLALIALAPLVIERGPVQFVAPYASIEMALLGKAAVLVLLGSVVGICVWRDWRQGRQSGLTTVALLALAGGMTAWHWVSVDSARVRVPDASSLGTFHYVYLRDWQRELYLAILNRQRENPASGLAAIPHVFRPLPYGFTRSLEWITGDWQFACFSYRWFFSFWFLWGYYRLARLFHSVGRAWLCLAPLVVLYPLSIQYYQGQLTDPMSHALFCLAFLQVLDNRWLLLSATLALGVMAKETVAIVVLGYGACFWRQGFRALVRTGVLAVACVAAYLAVRLPVGWDPSYQSINGTQQLMIASNLALPRAAYRLKPDMVLPNYLHPVLFIGLFLPWIAWRWRQTDPRLKALFLTVTPLLMISNLCFGWLYESRNYVPLLPLLSTLAFGPTLGSGRPEVSSPARKVGMPV